MNLPSLCTILSLPRAPSSSLTLSPPATGMRGGRCSSWLLWWFSHHSASWQVFPLDFIPGSTGTCLTMFPRLGTPELFPAFGAFTLQPGQGWALGLILEKGIWMLSALGMALQVIPSSSCVTPHAGIVPWGLHRAGPPLLAPKTCWRCTWSSPRCCPGLLEQLGVSQPPSLPSDVVGDALRAGLVEERITETPNFSRKWGERAPWFPARPKPKGTVSPWQPGHSPVLTAIFQGSKIPLSAGSTSSSQPGGLCNGRADAQLLPASPEEPNIHPGDDSCRKNRAF